MDLEFKMGRLTDAREAWELVQGSTLDDNSLYFYLVMFSYFKKYAAVIRDRDNNNELVGFICGFAPEEDTYFCWQVGVNPQYRGQKIASRVLDYVTKDRFSNVQATVTPSNIPSTKLFEGYSKKRDMDVKKKEFFPKELFKGLEHEEEILFDIK